MVASGLSGDLVVGSGPRERPESVRGSDRALDFRPKALVHRRRRLTARTLRDDAVDVRPRLEAESVAFLVDVPEGLLQRAQHFADVLGSEVRCYRSEPEFLRGCAVLVQPTE